MGRPSSLPIHTPVTRWALYPTNQASRKFWLVPVLPATGRDSRAARPVPDVMASESMAFMAATCPRFTTRPGPEPARAYSTRPPVSRIASIP